MFKEQKVGVIKTVGSKTVNVFQLFHHNRKRTELLGKEFSFKLFIRQLWKSPRVLWVWAHDFTWISHEVSLEAVLKVILSNYAFARDLFKNYFVILMDLNINECLTEREKSTDI